MNKTIDLNINVPKNVTLNLKINGKPYSTDKHGHIINYTTTETEPVSTPTPTTFIRLFSLCTFVEK